MIPDFNPEYVFIQDDILYISNSELSKLFQPFINENQDMLSIDCQALWQILIAEDEKETLLLHLDYPKLPEIISIEFVEEDKKTLMNSLEFDTLGILIDFNPTNNEAKSVVFIPNIKEGLIQIINSD